MKTRYAIMAKDIQSKQDVNVFKDQRTFKSLPYAKKKLLELDSMIEGDIGMFVRPIKTELFCPHCKCTIDFELEEREVEGIV